MTPVEFHHLRSLEFEKDYTVGPSDCSTIASAVPTHNAACDKHTHRQTQIIGEQEGRVLPALEWCDDTNANCPSKFSKQIPVDLYRWEFTKAYHFKRKLNFFGGRGL